MGSDRQEVLKQVITNTASCQVKHWEEKKDGKVAMGERVRMGKYILAEVALLAKVIRGPSEKLAFQVDLNGERMG